jgi:hypothetical protein
VFANGREESLPTANHSFGLHSQTRPGSLQENSWEGTFPLVINGFNSFVSFLLYWTDLA